MNAKKEFSGSSEPVSRRAHNPESVGSIPTAATNMKRRHPADETMNDEYSVSPALVDDAHLEAMARERRPKILEEIDREPHQLPLQAFPSVEPWTDEDCNILADIGDEAFAEMYLGDQVAAQVFAACRQVSSRAKHYASNDRMAWQVKQKLWAFHGVDEPKAEADREKLGRTKRTIVGVSKGVMLALVAGVLSGCSYGNVFASHVSHPFVGQPVTPSHDASGRAVEGQINAIGFSLGKCYGRVCIEQAISYDVTAGCDACLRGGPLLYEGRVTVKLFGGAQ